MELRQDGGGGQPERAKEQAGMLWKPQDQEARGRGDAQAQDVLLAQRAGFAGCLLPTPETCHLLLGKETPSSWSLPLPHPWKPAATKLSAAPETLLQVGTLSSSRRPRRGGQTNPPSLSVQGPWKEGRGFRHTWDESWSCHYIAL